MTSHYLTEEGFEKVKQELEYLKSEKMPEIVERIARAKELGDLSENAEYQDAKEEQGFTAGRISELEEMVRKAQIIKKDETSDVVGVGSTIKALCDGVEREYTIVGSTEANPANGLISNESPIGKVFIGSKVGDKVIVKVPKGDMECEVLSIS